MFMRMAMTTLFVGAVVRRGEAGLDALDRKEPGSAWLIPKLLAGNASIVRGDPTNPLQPSGSFLLTP
jgi:hypothetical protein